MSITPVRAAKSSLYASGNASPYTLSRRADSSSPTWSTSAVANSSSHDRVAWASRISSESCSTTGSGIPGAVRTTKCSLASIDSETRAV